MPHFTDEQDVYARLGKLLQEVVGDERIGSRLQPADTIFQCRLRAPDARLTIKALAAERCEVALGETALQPEVVLSMDADTAHAFWLGELNPAVALARGDIQARGPAAKILRLVPLTVPAAERYRAQLEGGGEEAPAPAQSEVAEAQAEQDAPAQGETGEAQAEQDAEAQSEAGEAQAEQDAPAQGEAEEAQAEQDAPAQGETGEAQAEPDADEPGAAGEGEQPEA